jgi:hypothetical protein
MSCHNEGKACAVLCLTRYGIRVCCIVVIVIWSGLILSFAQGGKLESSSFPGHCQHDYECVVGCHRSSGCCCCILRFVVLAAAAVELLKLVMILGTFWNDEVV